MTKTNEEKRMDIKKMAVDCKKLGMNAEAYATEKNLNPIECRDLKTALGEKSKRKKIKRY